MAYNPSNLYTTIIKRPVGEDNNLYINIGFQVFNTITSTNIQPDSSVTAEMVDGDGNSIAIFTTITDPKLIWNETKLIYEYEGFEVTTYAGQRLTLTFDYEISGVAQPAFEVIYETAEISSLNYLIGENLQKHNKFIYDGIEKNLILNLISDEGKKIDAYNNEVEWVLYDTEDQVEITRISCTRVNVGIYTATYTPSGLQVGTEERYQGYFEAKQNATDLIEVSSTREFFSILSDPSFQSASFTALCSVQDVRRVYPNIDAILREWRNLDTDQREIYLQNKINTTSRYTQLDMKDYLQFDISLLADYVALKTVQEIVSLSGSFGKTDDQYLKILNREVLRLENIFHKNDRGLIRRG